MSCISEYAALDEDRAGLPLPAFDQTTEQMAAGRRAALELPLQAAKADLQRMVDEKNRLLSQSDVYRAMACEPGRGTQAYNTRSANLRLQAFSLGIDIDNKRAEVEALQAQLERAALAAPVVLTHDQCAAVDETIGAIA